MNNANNFKRININFISEEDVIVLKANEPTSDEKIYNNEFEISIVLKENNFVENCLNSNKKNLFIDDNGENSDGCVSSTHSESNIQEQGKTEKAEDLSQSEDYNNGSVKDQGEDDPENKESMSEKEDSGNSSNSSQPIEGINDAVHQEALLEEIEGKLVAKTREKIPKGFKKSPKKRTSGSHSKQTLNNEMENNKNLNLNKYMLSSTPRQRRYFLQLPRGVTIETPSDDCEIFISNIPINVREGELIPLFERFGTIWELRLLMSQKNPNRNAGFAFVRFRTSAAAFEATRIFDKYEILPGKYLSIRLSQPNLSLFVGNIHRGLTRDQVHEKMNRKTKGLVGTFVKNSFYEETKNCGFCFLEYENHQAAVNARRLLSNGSVWGRHLFVDWAQRRIRSNNDAQESKTVFVDFLPKELNEEGLKEMFGTFGSIERVTKIKDYAFILYDDHSAAADAINKFDKTTARADAVEISLAMPKMTKRTVQSNPRFNILSKRVQHGQQYFGEKRQFGSSVKLIINNRMDSSTRVGKLAKDSSNEQASSGTTTN